ncbi:MAG: chorismate mutase [Candidatus Omnitrophica bacterium]|nr:chorismate mutase [Candidatus Omnitrophota bacterium]
MTLNQLRKRIDRIDLRLLALLSRRAGLVLQVGRLKQGQGRPVFDGWREKMVLRRLVRANGGPFPSRSVERIFRDILAFSRKLERSAKKK